jgi:hypothetical protein
MPFSDKSAKGRQVVASIDKTLWARANLAVIDRSRVQQAEAQSAQIDVARRSERGANQS